MFLPSQLSVIIFSAANPIVSATSHTEAASEGSIDAHPGEVTETLLKGISSLLRLQKMTKITKELYLQAYSLTDRRDTGTKRADAAAQPCIVDDQDASQKTAVVNTTKQQEQKRPTSSCFHQLLDWRCLQHKTPCSQKRPLLSFSDISVVSISNQLM